MDTKSISENLKRYRKEKGYSQEKLAELTGISKMSIRRYETGERQPKIEVIQKIANVLQIQVNELLNWKEIPEIVNEVYASSLSDLKNGLSDKRYNYSSEEYGIIARRIDEYITVGNKIENLDEREDYFFNARVALSHEILNHLMAPYLNADIMDVVDLIAYYLSFTENKQNMLSELFLDLYGNKYLRHDYWEKQKSSDPD